MQLNGSALNTVALNGEIPDEFQAAFAVNQGVEGKSIIEVVQFVDRSLIGNPPLFKGTQK